MALRRAAGLTACCGWSDDDWNMAIFHIRSVASPFDSPAVANLAVTVLTRADAMGLLPPTASIERLDMDTFRRLVAEIAGAGIGSGLFADLAASPRPDVQGLAATLRRLNEALDASPPSASEWHGVYGVLGADELARLLGISPSSVRRYLSGSRATPDEIAVRLHFLALVIGDLAGAYNDFGVRRWFQRPAQAARQSLSRPTPQWNLAPGGSRSAAGARPCRRPGTFAGNVIAFRHTDPRYPFLWESRTQPAGRWHATGDGRRAGALLQRHA